MNEPRRIALASLPVRTYPCESINKVISEETLPSLTKAERYLAYAELSQSLLAIERSMQLALDRAAEPSSSLAYRPLYEPWMSKARHMRAALGGLLAMIRRHEKDLEPRAIEVEALERRRSHERRLKRQQWYVDCFTELVAERLGQKELVDMLRLAGQRADDMMLRDREPNSPSALRRVMDY